MGNLKNIKREDTEQSRLPFRIQKKCRAHAVQIYMKAYYTPTGAGYCPSAEIVRIC